MAQPHLRGESELSQDQYAKFRGLRARVTFLGNLRSVTGWLTDLTSVNAIVSLDDVPTVESGDPALIEIGGQLSKIFISGTVSGTLPNTVVFDCQSIGSGDPTEAPRIRVDHIFYELQVDGKTIHGRVNDISEHGVGLECEGNFETDSEYPIQLTTPLGTTSGVFRVRHCGCKRKRYSTRVGGLLMVEDRVDLARWRSVVHKLIAA